MKVEVVPFGSYGGKDFVEILMTNKQGIRIGFSDLGARINRWGIPNQEGHFEEIVLGHANAQEAFESNDYYGVTVGPVAGRIAEGRFTLNGKTYQLSQNDGRNHLHGGLEGYDLQQFAYAIEEAADAVTVTFRLHSPKIEYPGSVAVEVKHRFTDDNVWTIIYKGEAEETTLFNPTNHVYFNLNGNNQTSVLNHEMTIKASHYLPLDQEAIPLGEKASVEETPFDLREGKRFGDLLDSQDPQFRLMNGFDHPFILDTPGTAEPVAQFTCPDKGRSLEVYTTSPAIVVYTHNKVGDPTLIWDHPLKPYAGIVLETQEVPDAINQPQLGNIIVAKRQIYSSQTSYRLVFDEMKGK
ncbi:aldose epimerase family protein [Streptococcus ovuberis]|uniref:Aldose 1-epimerase n=1 Tax=Streptococcus ovuberis TaxID=1936207 RepID=A0A7X6MXZ3_9STRE|nr:aldose epimerase family protein [Streptococcus ovuberis]NKZ19543.1 galactose mutarotase [Streptococcus ovuberis]